MNRLPLLLLLAALSSSLAAPPAQACSCSPKGPPEAALASETAVFVGEVVEMDSRNLHASWDLLKGLGRKLREVLGGRESDETELEERRSLRAWLRVTEAFKGANKGQLVLVRTGYFEEECGFEFQPLKVYLVYAWAESDFQVSWCSRTRAIARAEADLEALRGLVREDLPGEVLDPPPSCNKATGRRARTSESSRISK